MPVLPDVPDTQYARSGDLHIAYQVMGDGPRDLVYIPGLFSHLEYDWEEPTRARFIRRLASFSRLIRLDKRGTGLSDRAAGIATLEERMDDVRAVMDAAGSERAALYGASEGGPMSVLFAATYPERVSSLILFGATVKGVAAPDFPWAPTVEQREQRAQSAASLWGQPSMRPWLEGIAPSMAQDERFMHWFLTYTRLAGSPGAFAALMRMNAEIDVRAVLPAIRVPTLVLRRSGDGPEVDRYMAERIPGAKCVELPGVDHLDSAGDADSLVDEIEGFLTGCRPLAEPDRVLATILFTDLAGSTERAAALGDRRWRELLENHDAMVRRELGRFRGREIKAIGDGFLATFDGPARAIRCACSIRESVGQLGMEIRAGLHTGECEFIREDVSGLAVHIAARVVAAAAPREVLVSSTVKDLVAGSGIAFEDRGPQTLRGVPGEWHLFAVAD